VPDAHGGEGIHETAEELLALELLVRDHAQHHAERAPLMRRLDGKVAIISGGSSGICRGVALRFAAEGASVAICSIDTESELAAAALDIKARGAEVVAERCDVGARTEIEQFVDATVERFGRVDVLVNGAAYMYPGASFEDYSIADYERSIRDGLDSVFHFMQCVFPYMRDQGGGKILNFASIGGIRGVRRAGGYAAAKMGLIGLSRSAANDWAQYGINVNCIAPMAMSRSWREYLDTFPEGTDPFEIVGTRRNALGRPGDPERDIGPAAAFLCSSDADFITGHVLPVDGGLLDLE